MPLRFINHLQLSLPCYIDGHRLLAITQSQSNLNYSNCTHPYSSSKSKSSSPASHKSQSDSNISISLSHTSSYGNGRGQVKQFHTSSQAGGTQAPASLRSRKQIQKSQSQYKSRGDREDSKEKDRITQQRRRAGQGEIGNLPTTSSDKHFESNTERCLYPHDFSKFLFIQTYISTTSFALQLQLKLTTF